MTKKFLYTIIVLCLFVSCKTENVIKDFNPISNFPDKDLLQMDFDMTNAVFEGLSLPAKDNVFEFTFSINDKPKEKYYYKIFYQNISYAFADDSPLSCENFYGSWENTDIEFKKANNLTIKDSFKIVGNPRNEKKYFGHELQKQYSQKDIEDGFKIIECDKQWYDVIKKKAKENKVPLKEQMYKDLLWNMESYRNAIGETNRRDRRNARVGEYEFMLVVATEEALKELPDYIKNISKTKDNEFVNPFSYFLEGEGKNKKGVFVKLSSKRLKAVARYDVSKGVYINRATYPDYNFRVYPDNYLVGNTDSLYKYAHFEEYYHNINTERNILQIQKIADVQNNIYTLQDFIKEENKKLEIKKNIHPSITDYPGKNIRCLGNAIELINPSNQSLATAKKENVGLKGRIGLTYGRYVYKIKFPKLLNESGLWNGLTNAAWLMFQNASSWNNRRTSKKGYVQENYKENETQRINDTYYSEIDIEIIKTSPVWPSQKNKSLPLNTIRNNQKVVFAATNWDLADGDNDFIKRNLIFDSRYKDKQFTFHRWNEYSRNLTSRVEISNDIFDLPFYYYVIEWKPTEIIWYLGKDLDHLTVVGYLSDKVTSIPNNQMVPVITQEYHYSEFWPPIIFEQGLIPYLLKETKGILYDLYVE